MRQHAEAATNLQRRLRTILIVDDCASGVRLDHRAQDSQRRRLAGAVVTEQASDATIERAERYVMQCLHTAEALLQPFDIDHGAVAEVDSMKGAGAIAAAHFTSRLVAAPSRMNSFTTRGMHPIAS